MRYILIAFVIVELASLPNVLRLRWELVLWVLCYAIHAQMRYYLYATHRLMRLSFFIDVVLLSIPLLLNQPLLTTVWIFLFFESWNLLERLSAFLVSLGALGIYVAQLVRSGGFSVQNMLLLSVGLLFVWGFQRLMLEQHQVEVQNYQLIDECERLAKQVTDMEVSAATMKEVYTLKERNRISRDIHDSVGHRLSTIIIQLGAIIKLSEQSNPLIERMGHELREFAVEGLQEVRKVVHDLEPQSLEEYSLVMMFEELFEQTRKHSSLTIHFRHNIATLQLESPSKVTLYRMMQEFLTNAMQHGHAQVVRVTLMRENDLLILTLQDDGCGAHGIQLKGGLKSNKVRIESLGGTFQAETSRQQGYCVRVTLPYREEEA